MFYAQTSDEVWILSWDVICDQDIPSQGLPATSSGTQELEKPAFGYTQYAVDNAVRLSKLC